MKKGRNKNQVLEFVSTLKSYGDLQLPAFILIIFSCEFSPPEYWDCFTEIMQKIDNMIFEIVLLFQKFSSFYFIMDKNN